MEEMLALLENYFIIKEKDKGLYYKIKDNYKEFKNFIHEKLGYNLIIKGDFMKLEKIPGRAEAWMGMGDFNSPKEYVFFMLLLMFLEDKGKEEQFLLSYITEFIGYNPIGEKIEWTHYENRRALIRVLKFAVNLQLIKINDGNEEDFSKDMGTEVLYENTGLSKYMVRHFSTDIMKCKSYKDLEDFSPEEIDSDKGIVRRHRVYRRLLLSPIIYNEERDEGDYAYIKNFRNIMEEDFRKFLNWNFHIHKNGAMIVLGEENRLRDTFPNALGITDIVLQLNKILLIKIQEGTLIPENDDLISIKEEEFKEIFKELRTEKGKGWSKEHREASDEYLSSNIIKYMESFSMAKRTGEKIIIYPLIGKVVGDYPEDYKGVENIEG